MGVGFLTSQKASQVDCYVFCIEYSRKYFCACESKKDRELNKIVTDAIRPRKWLDDFVRIEFVEKSSRSPSAICHIIFATC